MLQKQNIHFWILIVIATIALCTDYLMFVLQMPYFVALIISCVLGFILHRYFIKKKKITFTADWNAFDIVMITLVIAFAISKISLPDYSYDVANYHIYLQQNTIIDKVHFDFFAGKTENAFLFPLGDRMHYIFRYFLGYRLGTILSYYTLIIAFYEIKKILRLAVKNKNLISIFAIFCIFSSTLVRMWSGTYYIDTFSIPLLLEILYIVLTFVQNKELFQMKQLTVIGFLTGIATAIKVSNAILIIPIVLFGVICNRKYLRTLQYRYLVIPIALAIFPALLYALDNYIQVGNILFPYYNQIFRSDYFGYFSWKDHRIGIPSFWHTLIWPIYTSVISLGYGDDWYITEPIWAIGYVFLLIYLVVSFMKKKKNTMQYYIAIITILMTAFWIFILDGYMRYALIIPVLYSIIISISCITLIEMMYRKWKEKHHLKINFQVVKCWAYLALIVFLVANIALLSEDVKENYEFVLKDRDVKPIEIDGVWGTIGDDVYLTELLRNKKTPIYNLNKNLFVSSELANQLYHEKIENNALYVLIDAWHLDDRTIQLEESDFELGELVATYEPEQIPYLSKYNELYLYQVNYKGEIPNES